MVTILFIKPADANSVTTYFGTPANAGLQFSESSDSVLRSYNSSHTAGAEVALVFPTAVPIYAYGIGLSIKHTVAYLQYPIGYMSRPILFKLGYNLTWALNCGTCRPKSVPALLPATWEYRSSNLDAEESIWVILSSIHPYPCSPSSINWYLWVRQLLLSALHGRWRFLEENNVASLVV